jgi:TRAP-type C4-dicarboxylate transport system substrate-binding protein
MRLKAWLGQKHLAITRQVYNNMIHTVSAATWKKLTPAQQAMFRKENAAAPDPSFEYYHRRWLSAGMSAEATG